MRQIRNWLTSVCVVLTWSSWAQTPTITDFNPKAASYGTTITITGTNFSTTPVLNAVFFGNVKATVDSCTSTKIYVKVPAGAQYKKISVTANNRTVVTKFVFKPVNPCAPPLYSNSFRFRVPLPNSGLAFPIFPVIVDFDMDGKPDVATVSKSGNPIKINIYKNNVTTAANITASAFSKLPDINAFGSGSAAGGTNIVAADFDGDGKQDIVVPAGGSPNIAILRNTSSAGTIQFDVATSLVSSGLPIFAGAADIDGDGRPEILAVTSGATPVLNILRNQKTVPGNFVAADFATAVTFALPGTVGVSHFDVEDFDGDGKLDIAVACSSAATIRIFRNQSTLGVINASSLAAPVNITTFNQPLGIKLIDVDGDDKPDIVYSRVRTPVTTVPDSIITIHRNLISSPGIITAASFSGPTHIPMRINNNAHYFDMADFDGDQKPEIVTPDFLPSSVSIAKNTSSIASPSFSFPLGKLGIDISNYTGRPTGIAIGDLNSDNIPDIVCVSTGNGVPFPQYVTIIEGQKPKVTITDLIGVPTCPGSQVKVVYTTSGAPYQAGNFFKVEMSDMNGSFASPDSMGGKAGTTSDTITITIPSNAVVNGNYRLLISTTSPFVACVDTGYPVPIIAPPVALAGNDTTINLGDSVRLNASGGTIYTWQSSDWMSDSTVNNPYAKPYNTRDFIVQVRADNCVAYDTVKVSVTQNINFCSDCSVEYPGNANLVACYPLRSSTYMEESGNALHPAFIKNVTYTTDRLSNPSSAALFNGTNSIATRPVILAAEDSVTIMGWVYSNFNGQNTPLIFLGDNTNGNGYGITLDNCAASGGTNLSIKVGNNWICAASAKLSPITWTHVAMTKAGDTYTFFINGVQAYTGTQTSPTVSGVLMMGGSPYSNSAFNGRLDDVRLFNKALSAAQISSFTYSSYKRFAQTIADTSLCQGDSIRLPATGGNTYQWVPATSNLGISNPNSSNPSIKPVTPNNTSQTLNYIVNVTRTLCTDKDTVRVKVDNFKNFTNAGADDGFCYGGSAQLGASFGPSTYLWSPNIAITSTTIPNPVVNPSTTTNYILKGTRGVCIGYDTVKITVDSNFNYANAGPDTTICIGASVKLNASLSNGNSYDWGASFGTIRYQDTPTVVPTLTTTYTVTVVKGYCSDNDDVKVTVDNFVGFLDLYNYPDSSICNGDSIQLWAGGADSYAWTPSLTLNNATLPNPKAAPVTATTYKVIAKRGVCVESDTVRVRVDNFKNFVNAFTGDSTICPGEPVELSASGATSYFWSPPTGIDPADINKPTLTAYPSVTTMYKVFGTKGACSAIDSLNIIVGSNSSSSVDAGNDTTICFGDPVNLNAKGTGSFSWETVPPGGLDNPSIPNPIANPTTTTWYYLTVEDNTTIACKVLDSMLIIVQPIPNASIELPDQDISICEGKIVSMAAALGPPDYSYFWTPATGISAQTSRTPKATPLQTTTYTLKVSDGKCLAYDSVTIFVNPKPIVNLGPDITICKTDSAILVANTNAIDPKYTWIGKEVEPEDTLSFLSVKPEKTTAYRVKIKEGECDSRMDTINVKVVPKAYASFEFEPERGEAPLLVSFFNTSIGADTYYWDFGDTSGILGRSRDTVFVYQDTGFYRIILKVENSLGACVSYDTAYIKVDDFVSFYVPSSFSPNRDGLNDNFEVFTSGVETYKGIIYNRWGQIVYEQDVKAGGKFSWDGTSKGEKLPGDMYYYYFDFVTFGSDRESRSGAVFLAR